MVQDAMQESNDETATMESAVNQFESALGITVTSIDVRREDGKVVLTTGDDPAPAKDATPDVDPLEGMAWNDMVSKASALGIWDGQDKPALKADLREALAADELKAETKGTPDVPTDPKALAAAVEAGDVDEDTAKKTAADGGFKPAFYEALNGECKSAKDCEHGARTKDAHYCIGCQKTFAKPDPDAFGLTAGQAEAVPTVWKNQTDDLEEAIELMK